jgi:hypothetical protein
METFATTALRTSLLFVMNATRAYTLKLELITTKKVLRNQRNITLRKGDKRNE